MLTFNHFQLILFIYLLQMSTTKTCWPELVGKTADEAVQIIKEESGRENDWKFLLDSIWMILGLSKIHVCGPGSRTTRDVDDERVRVYVDEENKVTSKPTVG
jgi:hypothetical protein